MFSNPSDEWHALRGHYRSMLDEELLELAADFSDLTPTAQQALRDEMRLRQLGDPQSPAPPRQFVLPAIPPPIRSDRPQETMLERASGAFGARLPDLVPDAPAQAPASGPVEYTWKTPLCVCESGEQAWQICEMLRRAGMESWMEDPSTYANSSGSQHIPLDDGVRRILVAADQLDRARVVAAQPVPADILEQSRTTPPDYQPPACPRCGAADPLLEDVDPVNAWKCEACGAEWADPEPEKETGGRRTLNRG